MVDGIQNLDTPLSLHQQFDCKCYRLNVGDTTDYSHFTYAAAPIIHSYNPTPLAVFVQLALMQKEEQPIKIGDEIYQLKRFLTVQKIDQYLCEDDDGGEFRPTVKPHYAIAPANSLSGAVYNAECPIRLLVNRPEGSYELFIGTQSVCAHDGLASPDININELKNQINQARHAHGNLFITSYVIDPLNHHVFVTEHCLLHKGDHELLMAGLNVETEPKILNLLGTPIHDAVMRYNNESYDENLESICRMTGYNVVVESDRMILGR